MDMPGREQRLVVHRGRAVRYLVKVACGPDRDNARRGADGTQIKRRDLAAGHCGKAERQMDRVRGQRDVIGVAGGPRHMQGAGIVRQGASGGHASTSSTFVAAPWLSAQ